jgi:hypothetical protein
MTTARVIPFHPHAVGRRQAEGGREPQSPFRKMVEKRSLTERQIVHRRRMLTFLYIKRADPGDRPFPIRNARRVLRMVDATAGR